MRITVLRGGCSRERDVSLVSGAAVAQGLRDAGHEVFEADILPDDLSALDRPCDVVFPVLHGAFGEDGQLQAILEARRLPFVGSGSAASRVAMDKIQTKQRWRAAGLPTPAWHVATASDPTLGAVGAPCVVKTRDSGSSIGVYVCHDAGEALTHVRRIVGESGSALVEQFIHGTELTIGVLEGRALPAIRIAYASGFFDYRAKYSEGGAAHDFDTRLPEALVRSIQQDALRAHEVLGCRDLSRTDVMVDPAGGFHLLEINTLPGFTPRSLLPEAAARIGISFTDLVHQLARRAASRGGA
jgi:D-alanine-D-alanine ligase